MKVKKCLCCSKESKVMVFNQSINLCKVCSYIVNNKINYNFENKKSTNVLDIIKEINEWNDKDLYKAHLSLTEERGQLCI
ncbi:hypothetical protein [Aliarcobacter butzleri]|uniref:hypothetical protein n=1 Tax=Aliarcobacter butzleri TaxID=28197 RepID=UPI00263CC3EA|nr:hypothetical protein [Aliarcobacter butzleri]MDN5130437.1 hypothetical protein [Aliarcobacter butzleri]MDX9901273.1 hypothetical protein [Aliarcobacter sp.]